MTSQENDCLENKLEILIVEDSPTQAQNLQHLLESHHYNVRLAKDGVQALAMVNEKLPSMILTDIIMPGMNGYELCREIKSKENTQEIPVILLTSLTDTEDVIEGLSCGADNFITKPFSDEYLLGHIEQILANRQLFKVERVRTGVGVIFGGKKRFVSVDQQQMLSLLLSTFEAATQRTYELIMTQEKLRTLNDHLEDLVEERTSELQLQRDFAEILLNTAQAVILLLGIQGEIRYFNPYFEEILGCLLEEVRGHDWISSFIPEVDRQEVQDLFARALGGEMNRGNVNTVVSRNGSQHKIEWFDKTIMDKDGQISGVLAIGQILTRGKQ